VTRTALPLVALLVLGAGPSGASADTAPMDPEQQKVLIDQIRAQLGSNLADAMAAQQQLEQSLRDNAAQQAALQAQIAAVEAKIADLDEQIAAARRQEAYLAARIDSERAQLRQLARAIYEQPASMLVVLAQARSLSDLLTRVADLNVAGSQASQLKTSLSTSTPSQSKMMRSGWFIVRLRDSPNMIIYPGYEQLPKADRRRGSPMRRGSLRQPALLILKLLT